MTVIAKKYHIIERITALEDENLLHAIEQLLENQEAVSDVDLSKFTKPMQQTLDIEALKKEQGYEGMTDEEVEQYAKDINLTESLEELLAAI